MSDNHNFAPRRGGSSYFNSSNHTQDHQSAGSGNYLHGTYDESSTPNSPQPYAQDLFDMYGQPYGHGHGHGGQQGQHGRANNNHATRGQRYPMSDYEIYQREQAMQQLYAQAHTPLTHGSNIHMNGHHLNNAYGSGVLPNSTPTFSPATLHAHGAQQHQIAGEQGQSHHNGHWDEQLRSYNLSKDKHKAATVHNLPNQAARQPNTVGQHHARSPERSSEDEYDDSGRPTSKPIEVSRQEWKAISLDGHGSLKLSEALFSYTFLHELYLNSNRLTTLSSAIGTLRQLRILDVSQNKLTELPPELGMCVYLQRLLVFDNDIRTLPNHLGSLSRLEFLGIEGNPLDPILKQRFREKGHVELINHLLETGAVPPEPSGRQIISLSDGADTSSATSKISVYTSNILCDNYAQRKEAERPFADLYAYTPSAALSWEYRKQEVLKDILKFPADILCLQEVDLESFNEYFCVKLAMKGYKGVYWQKRRAKTMDHAKAKRVDGCAIFYDNNKYMLLHKQLVQFDQLTVNRSDMKGESDVFKRIYMKDHLAGITFFENRMDGSRFIVANVHTYAGFGKEKAAADVKTVQIAILMEQLRKEADKYASWPATAMSDRRIYTLSSDAAAGTPGTKTSLDPMEIVVEPAPSQVYASNTAIPLFVSGDFNSVPGSAVHSLLSNGSIPPDHPDLEGYSYGNFTKDGIQHPFQLKSAYTPLDGTENEVKWTNFTPGFTGLLDYIWYSANTLEVEAVLGPPDYEYLKRVPGWPHWHFPSDHMSLYAQFSFKKNGT